MLRILFWIYSKIGSRIILIKLNGTKEIFEKNCVFTCHSNKVNNEKSKNVKLDIFFLEMMYTNINMKYVIKNYEMCKYAEFPMNPVAIFALHAVFLWGARVHLGVSSMIYSSEIIYHSAKIYWPDWLQSKQADQSKNIKITLINHFFFANWMRGIQKFINKCFSIEITSLKWVCQNILTYFKVLRTPCAILHSFQVFCTFLIISMLGSLISAAFAVSL